MRMRKGGPHEMKLFIDTANIEEIREIKEWGILDGVTTNPSLVAQETGREFRDMIAEISSLVPGPISAEVLSQKKGEMVEEARDLAQIGDNVVIKIPITEEGLMAVSELTTEGIKTNMTLIFSPQQALLAAKAGATYVSPFVGRLDDIGHDGIGILQQIIHLFQVQGIKTQVISASIRHPGHVYQSFSSGAHIATIPYQVLKKMVKHPLTDIGIERFLKDWVDSKK